MLKKILIANRGEIARRVIFTCREMGIETVAVYSDADKAGIHVIEADEAVRLGTSEPSESYLNMDSIIKAAQKTGADAIHPGYGFLAENADFARRCEDEKIIFIGPPAEVIEKLGDKTIARQIMSKGGVPVIPGMLESESNFKIIAQKASEIGYPVLIKSAAGGGGKGMRVVASFEEIEEACVSASSEAATAFGSSAIYLEKYIDQSRHVEFQILCDQHKNAIHLNERECSIQRRHQKIIEETPSIALTPELRDEMGKAAVAAARASGYVNAGTVEFLLGPDNSFYFLEVNTRLQVEHPITEMTTGIDLVRRQIMIADGQPMGISQEDIKAKGHAIECRIYAEDPENDFFPSPGTIEYIKEPSGPGIRNDCGIYQGCTVPMEYDPILSKLVCYAEDRQSAVKKMIRALNDYVISGIKTPIPFLVDILKSQPFESGQTYTDFIDTHFKDWKPALYNAENLNNAENNAENKVDSDIAACIAYIADELCGRPETKAFGAASKEAGFATPWQTLGSWNR